MLGGGSNRSDFTGRMLGVWVDLEVAAQIVHADVEGHGIEKSDHKFEHVPGSDEHPELRPDRGLGIDWKSPRVEMRDGDDREAIHKLAYNRRAVVAEPKVFPLGQALPIVEESDVAKLSCEIRDHGSEDRAHR